MIIEEPRESRSFLKNLARTIWCAMLLSFGVVVLLMNFFW